MAVPAVFIGGISPSYHRPVVGIQVFELKEGLVDVSAWLPVLCDGEEHVFEIKVVGIDDSVDGNVVTDEVGSYWVISGKIFVWLDDDPEAITTGAVPSASGNNPQDLGTRYIGRELLQQGAYNASLDYLLEARRELSITNTIVTQHGPRTVSWTQAGSYIAHAAVGSYGLDQLADISSLSRDEAVDPGGGSYVAGYAYPLRVWTSVRADGAGNTSVNSTMRQGMDLAVRGDAVFPSGAEAFGDMVGSKVSTTRDGAAYLFQKETGAGYMTGKTEQVFSFEGLPAEGSLVMLYSREVAAENDVVLSDREVGRDEAGMYSVPAAATKRVSEWAGDASVGRCVRAKLDGLVGSEAGFERARARGVGT